MKPESAQHSLNSEFPINNVEIGVNKTAQYEQAPKTETNFGGEHFEQLGENQAASVNFSGVVSTIPSPVTDIYTSTAVAGSTPSLSDNPLVASDDDLIEKEWVDRAKKIVNDTQNDPYGREEAVSKLQSDYLNKRYGRIIGDAN